MQQEQAYDNKSPPESSSQSANNNDSSDSEIAYEATEMSNQIPDYLTEEFITEGQNFLLRNGPRAFLSKYYIEDKLHPASILCILDQDVPAAYWSIDAQDLMPIVLSTISDIFHRRQKLQQYNTPEDAAELINNARNIIVLTGAGVSTSLGIPDFRSDTGIYTKLAQLGLSEPQDVFDLSTFLIDPSIFYTFAKDVLPTTESFSPTHLFLKVLDDHHKLLTNYTQNIDNLEVNTGLSREKIVQCHGSFATATCMKCKKKVPGAQLYDYIRKGEVAYCKNPDCGTTPVGSKRQFSVTTGSSDEDDAEIAPGVMKPDITFFGEKLPDEFEDRFEKRDINMCDLLICIGTSLKVAPVSEIVRMLPSSVPQIYINRQPCRHYQFDITLLGNCDDVVAHLCHLLGWELNHPMLKSLEFQDEIIEIDDGDFESSSSVDATSSDDEPNEIGSDTGNDKENTTGNNVTSITLLQEKTSLSFHNHSTENSDPTL
ncbi:hypothetical protein CANCADRAFT_148141 [Tortispora caseinolytica NRRL Y-17796]|uniref:Deacetylase sirtuin-type domain-containing protein n=1 Tax=Tortispora caseinolytica NRRL Y-17796 TaxID=767744 RepID=A0A1E4TGZ2_9ASCO|nr:hypothetical protein CANCADRAFT_148141 [Tortispora caseinolytica NRRL Y-17796]